MRYRDRRVERHSNIRHLASLMSTIVADIWSEYTNIFGTSVRKMTESSGCYTVDLVNFRNILVV